VLMTPRQSAFFGSSGEPCSGSISLRSVSSLSRMSCGMYFSPAGLSPGIGSSRAAKASSGGDAMNQPPLKEDVSFAPPRSGRHEGLQHGYRSDSGQGGTRQNGKEVRERRKAHGRASVGLARSSDYSMHSQRGAGESAGAGRPGTRRTSAWSAAYLT